MRKFTLHTISGEERTVEAERYEINQKTGCVDFFDERSERLKTPIFFVYGLEFIEERQPEGERAGNLAMSA